MTGDFTLACQVFPGNSSSTAPKCNLKPASTSLSLQWWHSPLDFIPCSGQTAAGHEVDPGEFLFLVSGLWWLWVPAPERWWGDHRGGSEGWWHAQRACLRTEKAGLSCPGSPDEEESRVMKGSNTCGLSSPPNTALMWQSFLLTLSKQRTNSSYLQARWGRRWGRGVGTSLFGPFSGFFLKTILVKDDQVL